MRLSDLPFPVYGDPSFRGKCPTEALEQVTFETADHKEATMSFKEKRKPRFGQG